MPRETDRVEEASDRSSDRFVELVAHEAGVPLHGLRDVSPIGGVPSRRLVAKRLAGDRDADGGGAGRKEAAPRHGEEQCGRQGSAPSERESARAHGEIRLLRTGTPDPP